MQKVASKLLKLARTLIADHIEGKELIKVLSKFGKVETKDEDFPFVVVESPRGFEVSSKDKKFVLESVGFSTPKEFSPEYFNPRDLKGHFKFDGNFYNCDESLLTTAIEKGGTVTPDISEWKKLISKVAAAKRDAFKELTKAATSEKANKALAYIEKNLKPEIVTFDKAAEVEYDVTKDGNTEHLTQKYGPVFAKVNLTLLKKHVIKHKLDDENTYFQIYLGFDGKEELMTGVHHSFYSESSGLSWKISTFNHKAEDVAEKGHFTKGKEDWIEIHKAMQKLMAKLKDHYSKIKELIKEEKEEGE